MGLRLTETDEDSRGSSKVVNKRTMDSRQEGNRSGQNGNVIINKRQDRQEPQQQRHQYPRPDLTPLSELTPVGINTAEEFLSAVHIRTKRFRSNMPPNYQLTVDDQLRIIEAIVKGQNEDYGVIDPDYLINFLKLHRIKNVEGMEDMIDSLSTEFWEAGKDDETEDLSCGFFVRWARDRALIDLMEKWLTSNVDNLKRWQRFKQCSQEDWETLAAKVVVVPSAPAKKVLGNTFVRAYVLGTFEGGTAEVMSLDRGNMYQVPMEKIYIFKHDLLTKKKLRAYTLFAVPERIKYPEDHQGKTRWKLLTLAFRAFKDKYPEGVRCRILSFSRESKEVSVKLIGCRQSVLRGEVTEEFHVFFSEFLGELMKDDIEQAMRIHDMRGELTRTIEEGKMNIEKLESYPVQLIGISEYAEYMYVYLDLDSAGNSKLATMQEEYNRKYVKLINVNPKPGRACAWFNRDDEVWYRVVVLQVFHSDAMVQVWLVDWGEARVVLIKELRHLHMMFAFPATVLKVRLAHVGIKKYFPVKVFLERFIGEKLSCTPIDVEVNEEPGRHGEIEYPTRCYGAIFRTDKGLPTTIQEELWKAGHALPNGPVISNFMKKSKVTYYKSIMLETELKATPDTAITFHPFKADAGPRIPDQKVRLNAADLPPAIEECMSHVFISSPGTGPSNFYVQSVLHVIELNQMEDDLLKVRMRTKALKSIEDPEELVVGTLVVIDAVNPDQKRTCKRMMIIGKSAGSQNCFDGLLIDHGETKFAVPVESMKWPPECIKTVPPMCQRVHLEMPPGYRPACLNGFDYNCCEFWKSFIKFWQEQESAYWLWTRKEEHTVVFLDELEQQLAFDVRNEDWIPGPLVKRNWQEQLNELWLQSDYQHPILSNFYTSIGVLVAYHTYSEKNVQFLDMMDFLVKRNYIVKQK